MNRDTPINKDTRTNSMNRDIAINGDTTIHRDIPTNRMNGAIRINRDTLFTGIPC